MQKRRSGFWLLLIVLVGLILVADLLLGLDQTRRQACTDMSDPRYNPPAETCGQQHATP